MKYWLPSLVWMTAIWLFSNDLFSAKQTGSLLETFLHWAFPSMSLALVHSFHIAFRKCAHMVAYALLAYTYLVGISKAYSMDRLRRDFYTLGFVFCLVVIWASIDELHQSYSLVRTGTHKDVAWDAMGSLLFFCFLFWVKRMSLARSLRTHPSVMVTSTLNALYERSKNEPVSLGQALASFHANDVFPLLALMLSLPFLQPVPLGPLTVIGGLTFIALGLQKWNGLDRPRLPQKMDNLVLGEKTWKVMNYVWSKVSFVYLGFTKPRYVNVFSGTQGRVLGAFMLVANGALMAIPFGFLPMNNFLPALTILIYCVAELEDDGLWVLGAFVSLVVTVVYFASFFWSIWALGMKFFA